MSLTVSKLLAPLALAAATALLPTAQAKTRAVHFDVLTESATIAAQFVGGDTLRLDTLVTEEFGALTQSITFTVGAGVTGLIGEAAWEVSTAAGPGPRLTGVNIDIFDSGNTLVASDTFAGVLAGFAHSTFANAIGPGTYKMIATGTGVRESSLDVTLSFTSPVPEPESYAMLLAGLGVIGMLARRRHP